MPSGGVRGVEGNLVRAHREKKNWSQADLARAAGCGVTSISRIENNEQNPGPALFGRLARALDVAPEELAPMPHQPTLRDIRERLGLTVASVAALADISASSLSLLERGIVQPRQLEQVARAYGMDIDTFRALLARTRRSPIAKYRSRRAGSIVPTPRQHAAEPPDSTTATTTGADTVTGPPTNGPRPGWP